MINWDGNLVIREDDGMIMKEARNGKITEEIRKAAEYEGMEPERLRRLVASGRAVIPRNINHHFEKVRAIGEGLKVKVNVNIGTSMDYVNLAEELEKLKVAEKYNADSIMDLSTGGDIKGIRKEIIKASNIMVGTVPIYQAGILKARQKNKAVVDMTEDDIFRTIEEHGKDGVDFITVHCGVNLKLIERLKRKRRVTGMVSRGGSFLLAWMLHNEKENPLYSNFDYLLEIAQEYEMTLSLGDGLRPGGIADATDAPQIDELITLGELVRRARKANVQAMVEGPGHIPLHQIEANIQIEKALCHGAPFYVLGPIVTDIFPGYDHISAAIGGAIAGMAGADFLCYVTPAEHLALPTVEDVKEGLIASKLAAHAVDISKGRDIELDMEMDGARYALRWERQFELCFDKEKAREYRERRGPATEEVCSMCGDYCALKTAREYLESADEN